MVGVARIRKTSTDGRASIACARRAAHSKTSPGFTLLELMFTVSVLAILASLGVPAMQEMLERNRLKGAAQAFAEDLQWVRGEAIRRNRDLHLIFDAGSPWCYGISEASACDCHLTDPDNANACTLSINGTTVLKHVPAANYAGVGATATFDLGLTGFERRRGTTMRMGSGSAGSERHGNGSVTFNNPRDEQLKVILSMTGRVRVCSPDQSVPGFRRCD
ncbi:type IV fimbrial biogenesis protein FimT [Thiocapsa roseopersicina]|uniref:Type II secretion system protein H n=2 Tax=Thiocapsa roseopersicina TaxID=1058 RepID=A0A1H2TTE0_THIRO|nr:type IV fimbrial biogenesis protein FimT [Thiocapsa roseopersicina]